MKRLFLLAMLPMLLAPAEGGCVGSCNCPSSSRVYLGFPAELNVRLAATGPACSSQPHCDQAGDGGGCTEYDVALTGSGSCHLTARAADGRHTTTEFAVVGMDLGCCGTGYRVDSANPVSLTFSQDASTDTGG